MRTFLLSLGFISLIVGIIGIFVPLLPTTPFLILSAFAFSKSSERFHHWLLNNKYFGPPIHNWQERRAISMPAKLMATIGFLVSSLLMLPQEYIPNGAKIAYVIFTGGALLFIWTRSSR